MARKKKSEELSIPWIYKGKEILEVPEGFYGFIYCITEIESGKIYIGKKALKNYRTKISHVLNERTNRMNKVKEREYFESNWRDYYGSDKDLLVEIKERGKDKYRREILYFVTSKKLLSYYEIKEQMLRGVIEPGSLSYNGNIAGAYFKKDFNLD